MRRVVWWCCVLVAVAGCSGPGAMVPASSPQAMLRGTVRLPAAAATAAAKATPAPPARARRTMAPGARATGAVKTVKPAANAKMDAAARSAVDRLPEAVVYAEPLAPATAAVARTTKPAPSAGARAPAATAQSKRAPATRASVAPAARTPQAPAIRAVHGRTAAGVRPRTYVLSQRAEAFSPRVVAVTTGDTVVFENHDRVYHNAFSVSPARTFDLGKLGPGAAKRIVFAKPGVVRVFCDLHPTAAAYVFVSPTTHWARPDVTGEWVLGPLPPGEYVVRAWHPEHGERKATVALTRYSRALELAF